MQVSLETTGNIDRKMTVTLPAVQIDQEVEKRLKAMVGRVRIDGFRPGKVPFPVVKNVTRMACATKLWKNYSAHPSRSGKPRKIARCGFAKIDLKSMMEEGRTWNTSLVSSVS